MRHCWRGLSPFIWRKYLDFAAVADIHAMKRQIHAFRGHDEIAVEGHNIKLGRGGIREIEFFVQTQQLIAGGRHPELRGTRDAAHARRRWRTEAGSMPRRATSSVPLIDSCASSRTVCRWWRTSRSTHCRRTGTGSNILPVSPGFPAVMIWRAPCSPICAMCNATTRTLFENAPAGETGGRTVKFPSAADDRETLDRLSEMGFRQPLEDLGPDTALGHGSLPSLKSAFARGELAEIVPMLLHHFARSANPDGAVIAFDRFLAGLHGGGRLFSLLRQNPDLIAVLALVLGTAPRLADVLAQSPEVMDAVIDPSFFGALPEDVELTNGLGRSLAQANAYEDFLDRIRIFAQEQMFLIGTRILSGTVSAEQAGEAFARLADVLVRALHRAIQEKFAAVHGYIADQQTAVLALGKLGGREMTASSDLDLIVIYDFDPEHPESTARVRSTAGSISRGSPSA